MSDARFDKDAGIWTIAMRSAWYVFGIADDGAAIRHVHWGPAIGDSAAAGLAAYGDGANGLRQPSPGEHKRLWGMDAPDEYVPWGGLRYEEPSLKAEFADGTRNTECRYAGQRITREGDAVTVEVDLADARYGLTISLCYRAHDGFDVLERWVRVRNDGVAPVTLAQALSANWPLPRQDQDWQVRYLHGGWSAETQLTEAALPLGKFTLESRRGLTSLNYNPWFAAHAGASEDAGQVWSGALAWSGSWKLVFETTAAGPHAGKRTHVTGGWNDFDWSLRLAPGEETTTPVFAGLYSDAGFGGASREWHAWQRAHVLPRTEPRPVLYNSWEATSFAVTEAGQTRLAELAARIGAELFVVDDGWFKGRHNDQAGLGDWTVDPAKFPDGLQSLIARVRLLGMKFGLWVEPEMVNADSDLYRAHPDWVYHFRDRTRSERRNQLVLNLARDDVADWLYQTLHGLLGTYDIDFIKWDFNRPISEPGWPDAVGDNPERVWTQHVRNLYAIIDRLRDAHPAVEFEGCSSGGGRVDLGILSRVEQVWTSDNTDAWDRLAIQEGFSQAYPALAMMAWVTDSPNPLTSRELPLSFRFHSAMAGSLGVGGDLASWSEAELDEAAALVAAYKQVRRTVQLGTQYRLTPARGKLTAWQYLLGDEVVVLGWWAPRHYGEIPPPVRLTGLDPAQRYQTTDGTIYHGAALMNGGLRLVDEPAGADGHNGLYGFGSRMIRLSAVR
ncbi:MAG TPA: alpha-galactosidase [Streptosporangiaceae bacterium]|nr:alpha-galactosidase [Streptosporangiaceae bacterium]